MKAHDFDREVRLDAASCRRIVTWGTSPEDVVAITGVVPDPAKVARRRQARRYGARARLYGPRRLERR